MSASNDTPNDLDARASEPITLDVTLHIKQTIQRAAALSGVDDSVFTMNAAYQSALATIAAHERTSLGAADHAAFFEALDNPAQPTEQLKRAFARHKLRVLSK